jgi:hypothetical protein
MVNDKKALRIVDYTLFDYDACLALEKLDSKVNIAYLNGDKSPEQADGLEWIVAIRCSKKTKV